MKNISDKRITSSIKHILYLSHAFQYFIVNRQLKINQSLQNMLGFGNHSIKLFSDKDYVVTPRW